MLLHIQSVNTYYGKVQALHGVSLHVDEGEIVTLIGANGAGKSTLLMSICGDPRPSSGSIAFDGAELVGLETPAIIHKGIAIAPEGRRVFARLTVEENLAMGAFFASDAQRAQSMERVLRLFPRLKERFAQRAGTMSGGEQQMLAMGRALMSRPRLLLLDEPSMGLAPLLIREIFNIIVDINKAGTTVLLVEQNANMALSIAHRAYVLETGRIALSGDAKSLAASEEVRKAYLGG